MKSGISTGGRYLSEDGGGTFKPSNKGIGAGFSRVPGAIGVAYRTTENFAAVWLPFQAQPTK